MTRRVQLVLLCEDRQHETFVRQFLKKMGWEKSVGRIRVKIAPPGKGAAEQFVRNEYPIELKEHRRVRNRVATALIVVRDGDNQGLVYRVQELSKACELHGIEPRQDDEAVAIVIPTWNIETWIAYLTGETVDETKSDYPRLQRQRDCRPQVEALVEMCRHREFRQPLPQSLKTACEECRRLVSLMSTR